MRGSVCAFVSVAVLASVSTAQACSCAGPPDRFARAALIKEKAAHIVLARIVSARQTRERIEAHSDPVVVAQVEVIRNIKGHLPTRITVVSEGHDNGANCGYGNALLRFQGSAAVPLVLPAVQVRGGRYHINVCSQIGEIDLSLID